MLLVGGAIHFFQAKWRGQLVLAYADEKYFAGAANQPDVLVLGDSLVGRAFPPELPLSEQGDNQISLAKLWLPAGSYRDFFRLFDETDRRFKLIFVNQDALIRENPSQNPRDSIRFFFKTGLHFFHDHSLAAMMHENENKVRFDCRERSPAEIARAVEKVYDRYTGNTLLRVDAIEFLRVLRAAADQVVIVRLPRSGLIEEQLAEELSLLKAKLFPRLLREGVSFIELGEPLSDDHYCDGSHTSALGRTVRTRQLVQLIEEMLPSTQ